MYDHSKSVYILEVLTYALAVHVHHGIYEIGVLYLWARAKVFPF